MISAENHPYHAWLSFLLNNGLRRRLHPPPENLVSALGVKTTDAVLDFGCGPGFFTIPFAKVARDVVAVDCQPSMLVKVSRSAKKKGVKIKALQSDGQSIPLPDDSIDLIFLSKVYHELADKRKVLSELRRVLKAGGRIVIREAAKSSLIKLGPPIVNPTELSNDLAAAGFITLASAVDPSDDKAAITTACK